MEELERLVGRFITPTLVMDGEVLIGFAMNVSRIRELLETKGYLHPEP